MPNSVTYPNGTLYSIGVWLDVDLGVFKRHWIACSIPLIVLGSANSTFGRT